MVGRVRFAGLAGALLLSACASAPEPEPPQLEPEDPRIVALLGAVDAAIAADPGAAPKGLEVSVSSVDETNGQLVFDVMLAAPEAWGRGADDFTVYVSCPPADIPICTRKLLDAARTLKRR